jgi:hypothetical protein
MEDNAVYRPLGRFLERADLVRTVANTPKIAVKLTS